MAERSEKSRRTANLAVFLGCLMVLVAVAVREEAIVKWVVCGLAFLSMPVAMKHAVGDLAMGGGTGGLWRTLTTSAKPGDPAPPAVQP